VPSLTVSPYIIAQNQPVVVIDPIGWRSLYSNEWTSDHKPRQSSKDFIGTKSYGAVVGMPDQYRVYANPILSLKRDAQVWLADVLGLAWKGTPFSRMAPAQKKSFIPEWKLFMKHGRCFTDKGAWDDGNVDFIQGTNLGAPPMKWEVLILGGNKVDVLDGGTLTAKPESYTSVQGNYKHYRVRTVNINKLPKPEAFLLDKAVCHIPTTIKPDGTTGVFPQGDGKFVYPLWSTSDSVLIWDRLIKKEK